MPYFYLIFQLLFVATKSDSFVCPCLPGWLTTQPSDLRSLSEEVPVITAMAQQDVTKKKKGPPKFQHLPKARGTFRIPVPRETLTSGIPSQTTKVRMGPDTQSQVQVER